LWSQCSAPERSFRVEIKEAAHAIKVTNVQSQGIKTRLLTTGRRTRKTSIIAAE
jgi:hypothetical protein